MEEKTLPKVPPLEFNNYLHIHKNTFLRTKKNQVSTHSAWF